LAEVFYRFHLSSCFRQWCWGIVELEQQARAWAEDGEIKKEVYPHQIAFNLLPHVDAFLDDGYTKEEMKMLNEGRKIMGIDDLRVTCTCVRVPVFRAHSISISAEFEKPVTSKLPAKQCVISKVLNSSIIPKMRNIPCRSTTLKSCPVASAESAKTAVFENGLALWVTGDQLWKGAALNAIQIAELLHTKGLLGKGK